MPRVTIPNRVNLETAALFNTNDNNRNNTTFSDLIGITSTGSGTFTVQGATFTQNPEFIVNNEYIQRDAAIPMISEDQSIAGVSPTSVSLTQNKNITQIFYEETAVSRRALNANNRLQGLHNAGATPQITDEQGFQSAIALDAMRRDLNFTLINGVYSDAGLTDSSVADQTRGLVSSIVTNTVDGTLTATYADFKANLDAMFYGIATNGISRDLVIITTTAGRAALSKTYALTNLSTIDRDNYIGGSYLTGIIEPHTGVLIPIFTDNDIAEGTIVCFNNGVSPSNGMKWVSPVFALQADTGGFIVGGTLPEAGLGGERAGNYFEAGLNHGPNQLHGKVTSIDYAALV